MVQRAAKVLLRRHASGRKPLISSLRLASGHISLLLFRHASRSLHAPPPGARPYGFHTCIHRKLLQSHRLARQYSFGKADMLSSVDNQSLGNLITMFVSVAVLVVDPARERLCTASPTCPGHQVLAPNKIAIRTK